MDQRTNNGGAFWRRVWPVAGAICVAGSFALAIHRRFFDSLSIALGVLGLAFFLTIFIKVEFANLKHYVNIGLYGVFIFGIFASIYILAGRHNINFDLTPQKIHTLSDGTTKYLRLLKRDVEIVVFDVEDRSYRSLLDRYSAVTPRVKWSLHDPRKDPAFTRQFDPTVAEKTIYIRHREKKKRISESEFKEGAITNAIVEVTRETPIKIYFLSGHGELAFESPPKGKGEVASVGAFKNFLASRAMAVEELDLVQRGFVPADATLVAMAGPARDLFPVETRQLEEYLAGGGKFLLFFDLPSTTGESIDFANLRELLHRAGLEDKEEVVVDLQGKRALGHPLKVPVMWFNEQHAITEPLAKASRAIALPLVRRLTALNPAPKDLVVAPLIASSGEAWAETFVHLGSREVKAPTSMEAQVLGWAVESPSADKNARVGMRFAVFGSSELVKDQYITTQNTAAVLMLNTVNWLTEQEDLVSVPPRVVPGTPLILSEGEIRLVLILVVIAFPTIIFFGGISYSRWKLRA